MLISYPALAWPLLRFFSIQHFTNKYIAPATTKRNT